MKKTAKKMIAVLSSAILCSSSIMVNVGSVSAENTDTSSAIVYDEEGNGYLFGYEVPKNMLDNEAETDYLNKRFSMFDTFTIDDGYSLADLYSDYCILINGDIITASGTWGDNITWSFDHGTLELSGTGSIDPIDLVDDKLYTRVGEVFPWTSLALGTKKIIVDDGITRIPALCFERLGFSVTDVVLGKDIEYIDPLAFDMHADKTDEHDTVNFYVSEKTPFMETNFTTYFDGKTIIHGYTNSIAEYNTNKYKDCRNEGSLEFESIGVASEKYIPEESINRNLDYSIDVNNKTLNITWNTEEQTEDEVFITKILKPTIIGDIGDEDYIDFVETVKLQDGVKSIFSLKDLDNLKTIIVPDSVVEMPNLRRLPNISNLTIVANTGTYAESYAKENGINFIDAKEYSENSTLDSVKLNDATEPTKSTESATIDTSDLGDLNLDGKVGIDDAVILNKYLVDSAVLTEQGKLNADCDKDGSITAADSLRLLEYLVGSISEL